ncbi:MAG: alanine dehydrogenase, partial [Microthrixaceae bacterium]
MSTLTVGVPSEIKPDERRVAVTPDGVVELVGHGIEVLVQSGAGAGIGVLDAAYVTAGARIVANAEDAWAAELVCKVKEPQDSELALLRADLTLFTYLHLAAYPKVAQALVDAGTSGIAYETVMRADGQLPLLAPMSEIAGRMAVQAGARFLEAPQGGS